MLTIFAMPVLAHAEGNENNSGNYKNEIIHHTPKELRQEMSYYSRKDDLSETEKEKQKVLYERYDELKKQEEKNYNTEAKTLLLPVKMVFVAIILWLIVSLIFTFIGNNTKF